MNRYPINGAVLGSGTPSNRTQGRMVADLALEASLTGRVLRRGKLSADLALDVSAHWVRRVPLRGLTVDLRLLPALTVRTLRRESAGPQSADMSLNPVLRSVVHTRANLSVDCELLPVLSGGRIYRYVRVVLPVDLRLEAVLRGIEISTTAAPLIRTFCVPPGQRALWVMADEGRGGTC